MNTRNILENPLIVIEKKQVNSTESSRQNADLQLPTLILPTTPTDKECSVNFAEKENIQKNTLNVPNISVANDNDSDDEVVFIVPHNSFCVNNDTIVEEDNEVSNYQYEPYVPLQKVEISDEDVLDLNHSSRRKNFIHQEEFDERSTSFVYIPVVDNDIEEDIRKQMLDDIESNNEKEAEFDQIQHEKRFETRKLSADILEAVESFLETKIDLEKAIERDLVQDEISDEPTVENGGVKLRRKQNQGSNLSVDNIQKVKNRLSGAASDEAVARFVQICQDAETPTVDNGGVKLRRRQSYGNNLPLSTEDMQKAKNRLSGAGSEEAVARFVQDLIEEEMKKASSSKRNSPDKKQDSPELDDDEQMIAEVVHAMIREEMELEREELQQMKLKQQELCKVDLELKESFKNVIMFALFLFAFLVIFN